MPTPREVLIPYREEPPPWLLECSDSLNELTVSAFFQSRIAYYPGSGTDGHLFRLFGGSHCVHGIVHCDYGVSGRSVRDELEAEYRRKPKGYRPLFQQELDEERLQHLFGLDVTNPGTLVNPFHKPGPRLAGGLWAILEREAEFGANHGPARLAFLHICADAFWTYDRLWSQRHRSPYAVLLQDHGFGGNSNHFGGEKSPLYLCAFRSEMPEWLLVASQTATWPGYVPVSDFELGGGHGHRRRLYRRLSSQPVNRTGVRDPDSALAN